MARLWPSPSFCQFKPGWSVEEGMQPSIPAAASVNMTVSYENNYLAKQLKRRRLKHTCWSFWMSSQLWRNTKSFHLPKRKHDRRTYRKKCRFKLIPDFDLKKRKVTLSTWAQSLSNQRDEKRHKNFAVNQFCRKQTKNICQLCWKNWLETKLPDEKEQTKDTLWRRKKLQHPIRWHSHTKLLHSLYLAEGDMDLKRRNPTQEKAGKVTAFVRP